MSPHTQSGPEAKQDDPPKLSARTSDSDQRWTSHPQYYQSCTCSPLAFNIEWARLDRCMALWLTRDNNISHKLRPQAISSWPDP